ncbi:hypothetical protein [Poseidonocella sp. HB161398]|uniref:hypothetical protein n=1 Tax=Poseidonocella sp. HB161398 TaxID=2320855 RepID=UPI0011089DB3|nr:hypothetical protein [Poseidonocella sp. HB161398]
MTHAYCTQLRRKLLIHGKLRTGTGDIREERREWVTEQCAAPLFRTEERQEGRCRCCAGGWQVEENRPATEAETRAYQLAAMRARGPF